MNTPGKDYTHHSWLAAAALIAVLVAVSFIPPQSVGGVKLRRANILSDLLSFDDAEAAEPAAEPALFDEEEFHIDMAAVAERIEADTTPREVQITYEWLLAQDTARRERAVPDSARFVATLTPIEDFSDSGRIQAFCDTLLNAPRPVRIAFLGDSFIEGDILTADLRERLQSAYSGGGAGFAPMASPLTAFRRTVKTQSKGWTTYNIMQPGVKNYTNYAGQIEKMIAYVRQCFPGAAVLVLGVSDRSVKTDAGFEPMDAIPHMLDCQRRAARNTGAAFWPTCDAMRALGGMEQFVKNGWAGKDYTHINYAGGRRVAWALFDAINAGVSEVYTEQRIASLRRTAAQAVLDSARRAAVDRSILPAPSSAPLNPRAQ